MRKTAVGKPKTFIEAFCIDGQRVPFPFGDRAAVVQRVIRIPGDLSLLSTPIHVENTEIVIAATDKDKNAPALLVLNKLSSIRKLKLAWSPGRLAIQEQGVIFQKIALPVFVQVAGPRLQW